MSSRLRSICFREDARLQKQEARKTATSSKAGTFIPKGPSDESSLNLLFSMAIQNMERDAGAPH
jgi:hypothetical protein